MATSRGSSDRRSEPTVEERLHRVQRKLGRLTIVNVVLLVLLGGSCLTSLSAKYPRVVKAHQFELVDDHDRVLGVWTSGLSKESASALMLTDPDSGSYMLLSVGRASYSEPGEEESEVLVPSCLINLYADGGGDEDYGSAWLATFPAGGALQLGTGERGAAYLRSFAKATELLLELDGRSRKLELE